MSHDGGFSLLIADDERIIERGGDMDIPLSKVKTIWNRRRTPYFQMREDTHPADELFISESCSDFIKSLQVLGDDRFAVNPAASAIIVSEKANQLRVARSAGLKIPRTLISNDYAQVLSFERAVGPICAKPYRMAGWRTAEGHATALTAAIHAESVDAGSVEVAPTIYQEIIEKSFEVRMTIFGNYCCATAIDSQSSPETVLDWRASPAHLRKLSDITPPEEVFAKAKLTMKHLGLRFGTFDMAVTREGEWVFFEVNESGQFLWQEEFCPESIVLEPFIRFLEAADDNFAFDRQNASKELSFANISRAHRDSDEAKMMFRYGLFPDRAYGVVDETQ